MTEKRGQLQRQGNELEALLEKLNAKPEDELDTVHDKKGQNWAVDGDKYEEAMASLDISLDGIASESYSRSLDDSFFLSDEFGEDEGCPNPVPMGSGSFSRVPSGGFRLLFDSVRTQCTSWYSKTKNWAKKSGQPAKRAVQKHKGGGTTWVSNRRKQYIGIGIAAAIVLLLIGGLALIDSTKPNAELAAQPSPKTENNNFELIALEQPLDDISDLTFDANDFSIPVLDAAAVGDDDTDVEAQALGLVKAPVAEAQALGLVKAPVADAVKPTIAKTDTKKTQALGELRLYGRNDNVLADESGKKSLKLARNCVMREGPASRFNLVTELKRGNNIDVLTTTEEDWILEGNGLWTKSGQAPKLGPGTQFANATKGMSLPQPKSRVISSKDWRYVRSDKTYGYVGPACFK